MLHLSIWFRNIIPFQDSNITKDINAMQILWTHNYRKKVHNFTSNSQNLENIDFVRIPLKMICIKLQILMSHSEKSMLRCIHQQKL